MKIDFIPRFERSFIAAGVIGGSSLLLGGIQAISGAHKEKTALRDINNLQSPTYNPNSSILDYYNKAMQRYNTNPYQSTQYQAGIQSGNASTAAGINALQDRRSAIGGISRLTAINNNNALNQGISAENEQNQRFGQLGSATQMKSSDDQYGFNINKLMPYQQKLQMLGLKASGGAQQENAGFQNMFSGLGSAAMIYSNAQNGGNNDGNGGSSIFNYSGSPVNMNAATGGMSGNYSTLQQGSPFAVNASSYQNPYGE